MLQKTALIFFSSLAFPFLFYFYYFFSLGSTALYLFFFLPPKNVRLFLANSKLSLIPVVPSFIFLCIYVYNLLWLFYLCYLFWASLSSCFNKKLFYTQNIFHFQHTPRIFHFLNFLPPSLALSLSFFFSLSIFFIFYLPPLLFNFAIVQLRLKVFLLNFDAEIEQEKLEIKKK